MRDGRSEAVLYPALRGAGLVGRHPGALAQAHHVSLSAGAASAGPPVMHRPPVVRPEPSVKVAVPRRVSTSQLRYLIVVVGAFIVAGLAVVVLGAPLTPGGSGQLWTVLVTGMTTGGMSCLAVQGGLLATSLNEARSEGGAGSEGPLIVVFLVAKIAAYTVLGALLGLLGSVVQLSVTTRGFMQFGIGLFMLATGVRMLYPHPWLRFVALEPPASVRRLIRKVARTNDSSATPAFLGALTVLIPCGVTQAMMAIAITTGRPLAGAAVLAAFTLATSPLFFSLSYVASAIGRYAERQFNKVVAVLVIILGYVAIQTGAILVGHPLPFRPLFTNLGSATATAHAKQGPGGVQRIAIRVKVDGYVPNRVKLRAGEASELDMRTSKITGCTRSLGIPALKLQRSLKVTGTTAIRIPPQKPGTRMEWVCGMGMFTGVLTFE